MSREAPETHIQLITGTAALKAHPGAAQIAVETVTHNLVFRGGNATRKAIDNFSDQTVAGDKTLTGTTTLTGTAAFTGATTGVRRPSTVTTADTRTLTAAESGAVMICTKASATQVFTLPLAATAGLMFSFVCGHASGEIHIGVGTGDNIVGKTDGAADGTGLVSTATTGLLKDTAASNVVGDHVTLVSDGATTWFMVAVAGAWSVT
jgi:hypothetical protein